MQDAIQFGAGCNDNIKLNLLAHINLLLGMVQLHYVYIYIRFGVLFGLSSKSFMLYMGYVHILVLCGFQSLAMMMACFPSLRKTFVSSSSLCDHIYRAARSLRSKTAILRMRAGDWSKAGSM